MAGQHARVADHVATARIQLRQPPAHSIRATAARLAAGGTGRRWVSKGQTGPGEWQRPAHGRAIALTGSMALVVTARSPVEAQASRVRRVFARARPTRGALRWLSSGAAGAYAAALVA